MRECEAADRQQSGQDVSTARENIYLFCHAAKKIPLPEFRESNGIFFIQFGNLYHLYSTSLCQL